MEAGEADVVREIPAGHVRRAESTDAAAGQRITGIRLRVAQRVAQKELQSSVISSLELGLQRVIRAHADGPDQERSAREVGPSYVRLRVGPRRQQHLHVVHAGESLQVSAPRSDEADFQ